MKVPILEIIAQYFAPLVVATKSPAHLKALLLDLDVHVELNDEQTELIKEIMSIIENLQSLDELVKKAEEKALDAGTITEQVILIAFALYEAIEGMAEISPSDIATLPTPLGDKNWWKELALQVPGYLLLRWLRIHVGYVYEILYFVNIVTEEQSQHGDTIIRKVHWDRIPDLFTDPQELIIEQYEWSTNFNHSLFMYKFHRFMKTFSLPTQNTSLRDSIVDEFYENTAVTDDHNEVYFELLTDSAKQKMGGFIEPRINLTPIPSDTNGHGLYLNTSLVGDLPTEQKITDEWSVDFTSITEALKQSVGIEIHTDELKLKATLPEPYAKLVFKGQPEEPWVLIGNPEGARLELAGLEAFFEIEEKSGKASVGFGAKTSSSDGSQALKMVISPAEGDNFISKILGDKELAFTADLGLSWNSETGVQFEGGAGIEIIIPLDLKAGPLTVDQLRMALEIGTNGVQLEAAVSGGLDISVLTAVCDDIGLRAKLVPVPEGDPPGLLGSMDLKLEFKPPRGMGLKLDAAVVSGGGYLAHDESKFQYAGVAEISFIKLSLSAIGVLNTKMPDGSEGWSLFLSVFSEFPPLPLGFGITLNGVGGLVGIHRTLDAEALRERLLAGAMDSIMFPDDPVKNAPKIISDISAIFPPVQKQFIFGAMLKLGWGAPKSLITISLGVMVELPDPVRIALLGQLEALIPDEKVRIIELHMDVFGLLDFGAKTMSLDAVIRDSSIVQLLTLSGDMAMRASFSDQPSFMMSLGGYHPAYIVPAGFPILRRMKCALSLGKYAAIEVTCYMALTSNTFQMGGRLDIWVKVAGFSAEGYLYMDALIQFAPFGFIVSMGFGVSIKAGSVTLLGVDINGTLAGPNPWEVSGVARFEILKIKAEIKVDIAIGEGKSEPPEQIDVEAILIENLESPEIWSILEEDESSSFISLRERRKEEGEAAHPAGVIQLIQNVVPFNTEIERFGAGVVDGQSRFDIESVGIGGEDFEVSDDQIIQDYFAPAHFFEMTDPEKLKAPSFEKMDGGVQFGASGYNSSEEIDLSVDFEEILEDTSLDYREEKSIKKDSALGTEHFKGFVDKTSAFDARKANQKFVKPSLEASFGVNEPKFVLANPKSLEVDESLVGIEGATYSAAQKIIKDKIKNGVLKPEMKPVILAVEDL